MKLFRNSFLSSVIFTMLLAPAVVCTVKLTDVGAQKKADSNSYKYYTSVEVKPGDTLTSIAKKYITPEYASVSEYVDEICKYNHIGSGDKIHAGKYISVMYYSDEIKK